MTKSETISFIKAYLDGDTAVGNIISLRKVLEAAVNHLGAPQNTVKGWVARDDNREIHYFQVEPKRTERTWWDRDYVSMAIDKDSFPDLKWEDEPIEVELIIRPL